MKDIIIGINKGDKFYRYFKNDKEPTIGRVEWNRKNKVKLIFDKTEEVYTIQSLYKRYSKLKPNSYIKLELIKYLDNNELVISYYKENNEILCMCRIELDNKNITIYDSLVSEISSITNNKNINIIKSETISIYLDDDINYIFKKYLKINKYININKISEFIDTIYFYMDIYLLDFEINFVGDNKFSMSGNQLDCIERILGHSINIINLVKYDYDIDLNNISKNFIVVKDKSESIYIIHYEKIHKLNNKITKSDIDDMKKMLSLLDK